MSEKATVLVIDDEPDVREMIETGLSLSGYEVLTATGGLDALSIVRDHAVDAVITDFKMPGMDGGETITELKRVMKDAVYILCTGYLDHVGVEKWSELGVEHVRKPFTPRELEQILETALQKLASR